MKRERNDLEYYSSSYDSFLESIKDAEGLQSIEMDKKEYIIKLSEFFDVPSKTVAGILDVYIYNEVTRESPHNFTLTINKIKEINMFYCKTPEDVERRVTYRTNRIHCEKIDGTIYKTLPIITNTINIIKGKDFDNLFYYKGKDGISDLILKLFYIEPLERHSYLTCLTAIAILHYNKTGKYILPITYKNEN